MLSWCVNTLANDLFFWTNLCMSITFYTLFVLFICQQTLTNKRTLSMIPPFYNYYLCLLFLCILKFVLFPKYCKNIIVPDVSYSNCNSPSVTYFAKKHGYIIDNKEATSFNLQKRPSSLKVNKQQLRTGSV